MVKITEDLIRRRAEHNECIISTLEEISLHQQDIERIEHIDRWCRDLKILYLQSNLIPKIENVGRLKKLEYINLALNNIEKVENLEGCESLSKLDLTVNFVAELTSIESLRRLIHLKELFLTGNPCCDYEGYREYVIATLPQLQSLDGLEIEKSERILAVQKLHELRPSIVTQQKKRMRKREKERDEENLKNTEYDAQYSRISGNDFDEEAEKRFWNETGAYTPESRLRIHQHMEQQKSQREGRGKDVFEEKKEKKLQTDDGRMLNVNEAKVDFTLSEDQDGKNILLDVAVFKYLDTEYCDADVQPTYVRVLLKGKVLQVVLPEEVHPLQSTAQRSQTTGHLLITMPKVHQVLKPSIVQQSKITAEQPEENKQKSVYLEVEEKSGVDITNIVDLEDKISSAKISASLLSRNNLLRNSVARERQNSDDFVDDPDVPPLM